MLNKIFRKVSWTVDRASMNLVIPLLKRAMKNKTRFFDLFEKNGFHILPVHFYEPVPDSRELPDKLWEEHNLTSGIDFRESEELALLEQLKESFSCEYDLLVDRPASKDSFHLKNANFINVDAEIYYSLIRHLKPKRIIEIGSGSSTQLAMEALEKNGSGELTSVEPYPSAQLLSVQSKLNLIEKKVQDVPVSVFQELEDGDILFIDSSHVAAIGSDVLYEFLQILPRLKKGVHVHIHDIFLPANYPKSWVHRDKIFWNENYLLHAFLIDNPKFEITLGASYLHLNHPEKLQSCFKSYDPEVNWPASFWIKKLQD